MLKGNIPFSTAFVRESWSRCPTWLNLKIESKVTFDNAYCSIPSCCLVKAEEGAELQQWRNKVSTMLSRFSSPTKVWEKTTTSFVVKEGLIYPISTILIILLSNVHFLKRLYKKTVFWQMNKIVQFCFTKFVVSLRICWVANFFLHLALGSNEVELVQWWTNVFWPNLGAWMNWSVVLLDGKSSIH